MKALKVTNNGADGHYHIVYINSETGVALMSPAADGHTHEVMYDPPREPVPPTEEIPATIDMMTGMEIPGTPASPGDPGKEEGTWVFRPSGADFHEHELQEYKIKKKKSSESEDKIIKDCLALWQEAVSLKQDSQDKGDKAEQMYFGNQWERLDKEALLANDLAALTLNEIMPNIDKLLGYQIEQRTDIRYLPRGEGDQRAADLYNVASKAILDNCGYQREESKVFKDQVVAGMGVFNFYVDVEKDVRGTPMVERFPWKRAWYGPHEKDDLSDCEYEILEGMRSLAQLKRSYPKKAKEIEASYDTYAGRYPDLDKKRSGINGTNNDYSTAVKLDDYAHTLNGVIPLVDIQRKHFRLIQCSRVTYKEVTVVVSEEEDFFFTAYDWDSKDTELIEQIPGFYLINQMKKRIRITKFCGSVVLSDEDPADLPENEFFSIPVYAYRQNGEFIGKVEIAKDPQMEINKRRSQLMDLMNRLGASVIYSTPETFITPGEKERFNKKRSKPGAHFTISSMDLKPEVEVGAQLPAGVSQIMQLDQENLQRLMNVFAQQGGANESGVMFLEKQKGVMTGNQFLFDNLTFAKQRLGRLLARMIQRYYDPDRLQELLNSSYSREKFKVGGIDFADYSEDEILQILTDANQMEFDVVVAESAFNASTRLQIAKTIFELIERGAAIPPDLAFEYLDMPQEVRSRISEQVAAQSEQQAAQAQQTSETEVKKTLLAKDEYTVSPEEAAKLGLVPKNNPLPAQASSSNPIAEEPVQDFALNDALVAG